MPSPTQTRSATTRCAKEKVYSDKIWFVVLLTFIWIGASACGCCPSNKRTLFATVPAFLFAKTIYLSSDKTLTARSLFSIDSFLSITGIVILGLFSDEELERRLFFHTLCTF